MSIITTTLRKTGLSYMRLPWEPSHGDIRKIDNLIQHLYWYPRYLGALRPDTFLGARIYYSIMKMIHPNESAVRRRAAMQMAADVSDRIDPNQGYLLLDLREDPTLKKALELCDRIRNLDHFKKEAKKSKKPYLQNLEFEQEDEQSKAIFDLACHPRILGSVCEYLDCMPVLHRAGLSYSPNTFFAPPKDNSQLFHIDREDFRQIKCHVYIEDVSEDTGPLTVIPAKESRAIFQSLKNENLATRRLQYHDDDTAYSASQSGHGVPLCGPRGTIALVDTCNCFHYGSRPGSKPRYVIYFHFASPFSIDLPTWGRRLKEAPFLKEYEPMHQNIRNLVLGLSHLNFSLARKKKTLENYLAVRDMIEKQIPPDYDFILIDDCQLGYHNNHALPFLERDGYYYGPPEDDATAISELERMREAGAAFVVIPWLTFWWFDQYETFHRYLRRNYRCAVDDQLAVIFDLRARKSNRFF